MELKNELKPFSCSLINLKMVVFLGFFLVRRETLISVVAERTQQCSQLKCIPICCLDGNLWKPSVLLRGCRYRHSRFTCLIGLLCG